MTPTERSVAHKVLLVDDDDAIRAMMNATLERKGFDVVAAASVTEALRHITAESFDVLMTDLHMPNPGDGFTVGYRDAPFPTGCTYAARQRLPRRAERHGGYPSGSGPDHCETIRSRETRRTRPRKDARSQTYRPVVQGESGHDPAAVPYQYRRRVVSACETE